MDYQIREITDGPLDTGHAVIREAFGAVNEKLGITRENCPRFPSFRSLDELVEQRDRGARFFGAFVDGRQVGVVLVEREDDGRYFARRLAVLPAYWRRGIGEALMARAVACVRESGGAVIHIGIVYENTVLKNWYLSLGFRETGTETFPGLPFTVGFLEKEIQQL
jgi:GNAT superfamily N-acetyltransferase